MADSPITSSIPDNMPEVKTQTWDIDARLSNYVDDPQRFRRRLVELDGVISGGFALQFISKKAWEDVDIDICVQMGAKAHEFARYLEEDEGYDLASRKVGQYNNWVRNQMIHQYDRTINGQLRRIDLVFTIRHPVYSTLGTYTTALANAITGTHAYCLFPKSTLVDGKTFPLRIPDYFNGQVLPRKYQERGWKFVQRQPNDKETAAAQELRPGRRYIGDQCTLKIAFAALEGMEGDKADGFGVEGFGFVIEPEDDVQEELEWLVLLDTKS